MNLKTRKALMWAIPRRLDKNARESIVEERAGASQTVRISGLESVLYTAPHDLPDSVGLIWSPNVTNCHMVGPVDSAGFRWSKC